MHETIREKRMKNTKLKDLMFLIQVVLLFPASAFSHGWGGYEQGAKAKGMGGAFTGLADDPTAVFYNPAGIVQLDGTQISVGFAVPTVTGHFKSAGTSGIPGDTAGHETDLETQTFFIPNFYAITQVTDKLFLGFGEYTIYGLGFEWSDSFPGRFAPVGKKALLESAGSSLVSAYKLTDKLSIAAGGRAERANLELQGDTFVAPGIDVVDTEVSGDDYAAAWQAALFYEFTEEWRAGLSYRSETRYSFDDLDVDFSPQIPMVGLMNTKAKGNITMPQFVSLGIAWSRGLLTVTADVYWWEWSVVDRMSFTLDQPVAGQTSMSIPMNWNNTWSYALGGQYILKAFDRDISLRAGFMYETSPIPADTVNPAGYQGDNLLYDIGAGTKIGPLYYDIFFSYVDTKERAWNNAGGNAPNPGGGRVSGEFENYATYIVGGNITYKF